MDDSLDLFTYDLPPEMIARHPATSRDDARMMVVDRKTGKITDSCVRDLTEFLRPNDQLVLNNSRVVPARLCGRRVSTGGRWEGLYLGSTPDGNWKFIGQTRGRLSAGETIALRPATSPSSRLEYLLTLIERDGEGIWTARPMAYEDAFGVLNRFGTVPLPPYIRRNEIENIDFERYQTVYAQVPGSVAAPTAGFHFTKDILQKCAEKGIGQQFVTLHIGIGTFRPIDAQRLCEHRMHTEYCQVTPETVAALKAKKAAGGRIVAVGTTSVRSLETAAAAAGGSLQPFCGETNLFIRPPFEFKATDVMMTNFHLPRSSLLVMVSAFAGRELILEAYHKAMEMKYRFYSYGDSMLLV